jgi:hypothetical protein
MRLEVEPARRAGIKAKVRRFKSLALGLKELEKFIRDRRQLYNGRPLEGLGGMLPREAVVNWLLCAAISYERGEPYCFTSDPNGGDGIIYDPVADRPWPTEHTLVVLADRKESRDVDTLILDAVQAKESKGGAAYAKGKTLIVFLDAGLGEWKPNVVARKLPSGNFSNVWVVGLNGPVEGGQYTYGVTCIRTGLDPANDAPIWLVRIHETFESWEVERLQ